MGLCFLYCSCSNWSDVYYNPVITEFSDSINSGGEGCLSVPGMRGWVERPAHIRVKAYNEKGQQQEFELEGFPAIVMQHECDHLDGVLYVDRITDHSKLGFEEEVHRYHDLGGLDDEDDPES